MWLMILAGVIATMVLLYWVVRIAAMDGTTAALERAAGGEQGVEHGYRSDLIGLSVEKPTRRRSGPSNV